MSGTHPEGEGGDTFGAIDPKLTVFALANGMDLSKDDGYRRLEGFFEGRERGLVIEVVDAGWSVSAISWPTGKASELTQAEVGTAQTSDELTGLLEQAIESANTL